MNRKQILVAVLTLLLAGSGTLVLAGADTLKNLAASGKVEKKVFFGVTNKSVKLLKENNLIPKRVGLISVYVYDSGYQKFSAMAYTYGGTYEKKFGLNEKGANVFASAFAKLGVPAMKKQFADHGMELVIPIEFLETDEQKSTYLEYELAYGKAAKITAGMANWLNKSPHADGAADGFKMITTHVWLDRTMLRSIEELRVALGLDAVAVLSNVTASRPWGVALNGINLEIFGPNPEPLPDNKTAAKYYTPAIQYIRGNFGKGFKGVGVATMNNGKNMKTDFEGYDIVLDLVTKATLDKYQRMLDGGK